MEGQWASDVADDWDFQKLKHQMLEVLDDLQIFSNQLSEQARKEIIGRLSEKRKNELEGKLQKRKGANNWSEPEFLQHLNRALKKEKIDEIFDFTKGKELVKTLVQSETSAELNKKINNWKSLIIELEQISGSNKINDFNRWAKTIKDFERKLKEIRGTSATRRGYAAEIIAIGRINLAGFICCQSEIGNTKYDAVIEVWLNDQSKEFVRVQIKMISDNTLVFTGGGRSGESAARNERNKPKKYTVDDCDAILGVDIRNGLIYIVPIEQIWDDGWKNCPSKSRSELKKLGFEENWKQLYEIAKMVKARKFQNS